MTFVGDDDIFYDDADAFLDCIREELPYPTTLTHKNDNRIRKLIAPSHGSLDQEVYETPNCRALRGKGYCKVYLPS